MAAKTRAVLEGLLRQAGSAGLISYLADVLDSIEDVATYQGLTAGTVTASKPVIVDASSIISGLKFPAVARTATADGTGTGTIAAAGGVQFVTVTSANADHIVVLPTPTPGTLVILHVGANGYEMRSSAPTTVLINGGTGGAAVESAIAAESTCFMFCVSATAWKGWFLDADSDLAKVEAAA